jgi:glycolate oxidase FAD binding subunit
VSPLPEASKTVVVQAAETRVLGALAGQVFSSPLTPSAVTIVNRAAAQRLGRDAAALLVRAEGVEPAVARHERDITGWAGRSGLQAEVLAGEAEIGLWRQVRDFGWTGERAAVRLSVPPGKVGTLLQDLDVMLPASSGVVADAGTGTVWIGLHGGDPVLTLVAHLGGLTERDDGTLLLARASRDLKAEGDVWAPPPSPRLLETMWSLKLSFDPHQILNPGRFVAGL